MDISGMNNLYSEYLTSSSAQSSAKLEGSLKSDYTNASDDELMDVCKQFESYFLEKVFQEMQKTVTSSDESNQLVDYFKDQTVQQIASDATEQSGLGLAQMLYEQMRRNYGLDE